MIARILCALLLVLAALVACSRASDPPSATPPPAPPPPPSAAEAIELLRKAETFDDTHVGYSGELSPYVAAFRVVLADPNANAAFHGLVDRASPAGRLYGAAGLYFTDPASFESALARLAADGGNVTTQRGCDRSLEPVSAVIRSKEANRIEVAQGETLPAWFARHPAGGHCDLAGGCVPLSFVEDGRPAPRGPVR